MVLTIEPCFLHSLRDPIRDLRTILHQAVEGYTGDFSRTEVLRAYEG